MDRNEILKKSKRRRILREHAQLYGMMAPVLIHIFIFSYVPLYGILIAFQDYFPGASFLSFSGNTHWVGLKHLYKFVNSIYFPRLLGNTIRLSLLNLAFGFWVPIAFALLVNEIPYQKYKKFVQTASYLPHFISAVIVAGMVLSFISKDGLVNSVLSVFGVKAQSWNVKAKAFPTIYTTTNVWKSFGWGAILYLSSISSIDPSLYESTRIDGANRWQQMIHITVPLIKNTIAINLIMSIGGILGANSELILLLYNANVYKTADVFGTYVYREGLLSGSFSFGTMVGLFTQIINFTLVFGANWLSNKLTDFGLW